jgi:outer membrane protein assembly factor BamB
MRRDDGMPCAACGAVWPRRVRFCGRCGALLTEPRFGPVRPSSPRRRWARGRLVGAGLGLALAVLVALVTSLPGSRSPDLVGSAPEVALPSPGEVPARPEQRPDQVVAEATPARIPLCEPVGCEIWRRSLEHPVTGLTVAAERVIYLQDATVIGLDPATGVVRWRRDLDPLVGDVAVEAGRSNGGTDPPMPLVAAGEVGVAVATARGVQLLAEGGRPRWVVPLDVDGVLLDLRVGDDVVLIVHELDERAIWSDDGTGDADASAVRAEPRRRLTALGATDGTVRWARDVDAEAFALPDPGGPPDVLIARDGRRLVALELATGQVRFELPLPEPHAWPQLVGRYLVVGGGPEERLQVVATRDGSLLAELAGWPQHSATVDGRLIVIVGTDGGRSAPQRFEAVAIDPDGGVSWTRPLPAASGWAACCPSVLDLGTGRIRIVADPRREAVVVAAATGDPLWRDPLGLDLTGAAIQDQWQLGTGLLATTRHDAAGRFTLVDNTGQTLHLRHGAWPVHAPTTVSPADDLVLLASETELAAVRFP